MATAQEGTQLGYPGDRAGTNNQSLPMPGHADLLVVHRLSPEKSITISQEQASHAGLVAVLLRASPSPELLHSWSDDGIGKPPQEATATGRIGRHRKSQLKAS